MFFFEENHFRTWTGWQPPKSVRCTCKCGRCWIDPSNCAEEFVLSIRAACTGRHIRGPEACDFRWEYQLMTMKKHLEFGKFVKISFNLPKSYLTWGWVKNLDKKLSIVLPPSMDRNRIPSTTAREAPCLQKTKITTNLAVFSNLKTNRFLGAVSSPIGCLLQISCTATGYSPRSNLRSLKVCPSTVPIISYNSYSSAFCNSSFSAFSELKEFIFQS